MFVSEWASCVYVLLGDRRVNVLFHMICWSLDAVKERSTSTPVLTVLYSITRACRENAPLFSSSTASDTCTVSPTLNRPAQYIEYKLRHTSMCESIILKCRNNNVKMYCCLINNMISIWSYPLDWVWTSPSTRSLWSIFWREARGNTREYLWKHCQDNPNHNLQHRRTSWETSHHTCRWTRNNNTCLSNWLFIRHMLNIRYFIYRLQYCIV